MFDSIFVVIIIGAAVIHCTIYLKKVFSGEKQSGCNSLECRNCSCSSGIIDSVTNIQNR
ncbi:hypothetical protein [Desulfamplus magnetovallimortis]|uniref:hypothetical protein n=1 Tax=Desulfamplus magnetovallimortis TaxID=1246637 RepID=UPI0016488A26|nr:hypothetical protein [Desulfamplus magnetovallimortis]